MYWNNIEPLAFWHSLDAFPFLYRFTTRIFVPLHTWLNHWHCSLFFIMPCLWCDSYYLSSLVGYWFLILGRKISRNPTAQTTSGHIMLFLQCMDYGTVPIHTLIPLILYISTYHLDRWNPGQYQISGFCVHSSFVRFWIPDFLVIEGLPQDNVNSLVREVNSSYILPHPYPFISARTSKVLCLWKR